MDLCLSCGAVTMDSDALQSITGEPVLDPTDAPAPRRSHLELGQTLLPEVDEDEVLDSPSTFILSGEAPQRAKGRRRSLLSGAAQQSLGEHLMTSPQLQSTAGPVALFPDMETAEEEPPTQMFAPAGPPVVSPGVSARSIRPREVEHSRSGAVPAPLHPTQDVASVNGEGEPSYLGVNRAMVDDEGPSLFDREETEEVLPDERTEESFFGGRVALEASNEPALLGPEDAYAASWEDTTDLELEEQFGALTDNEWRPARSRLPWMIALAVVSFLLLLGGVGFVLGTGLLQASGTAAATAQQVAPEGPAPAAAPTSDPVAGALSVASASAERPAPTQEPAPLPAAPPAAPPPAVTPPSPPPPAVTPPSAPPRPAPRAPAGPSVDALLKQGWGQMSSNPSGARASFDKVLATQPDHSEAAYGVGYVLLQQGDKDGAQHWLCKSLRGADVDTAREVRGLLERNTLACP